jgi:HAD superfamily hydrolase (TIGR01509 family)
MNIIIPIGGKGERFSKQGYVEPKPLIPILNKRMIEYVIDNLTLNAEDKLFVIYNQNLNPHGFLELIVKQYPFIIFIEICDTRGAAETLYIGIENIISNHSHCKKCMILDCDTFYTENIVDAFRNSDDNMIFYTYNIDTNPVYSYIAFDDDSSIINDIQEKVKISDNANTGAYAFNDINVLHEYCKHVLDNNITFNNEPYTSCVISEMLKDEYVFTGYKLNNEQVFSLGTPEAVDIYINNTHAFLFDLDGTLVITDDIYYNVWCDILERYNIFLTMDIFKSTIQGNNDQYVVRTLLRNIDVSVNYLSELKDDLFIKNIDKLLVINGVFDIIDEIKRGGHKICIVTNCNRRVANEIVNHINIADNIDFVITNSDCLYGKPNVEPYRRAVKKYNIQHDKCIIFEDSKSGIMSGKSMTPKLLVGIKTIYTHEELIKYGVHITIDDYIGLKIYRLLNRTNVDESENDIINIIRKNSILSNIKHVYIDYNKLKGGFIADVIGFKIYTEDGNVYSCILKYENEQSNNLSIMAKRLKLYEREYYFYTDISDKITCIRIPFFYNLLVDKHSRICGMVLENLNEKKYKVNLNLTTESIDVTLKIVDRMSKLHCQFWNADLGKIFPGLKGSCDTIFRPFFSEFIYERQEEFKRKWYPILKNTQRDMCDKILSDISDIQKRFSVGRNLTLIHGDIKSPNIFYDVENNYEPYFLDWQHCAIGKGVQDLIFFIIESFDIVNIIPIYDLATRYYYMKLIENGVVDYNLEDYKCDLYDAICYVPFFTSVWFGTIPQDELIDKNFPYFFINKMLYLLEYISN